MLRHADGTMSTTDFELKVKAYIADADHMDRAQLQEGLSSALERLLAARRLSSKNGVIYLQT